MAAGITNAPNETELSSQLVRNLTHLLDSDKPDDALKLIREEKFSACLKDCSWDLIPIVSGYLNSYNLKNKLMLFQCCEILLETIASHCNPAETLLEFIEQAECPDNDAKFCAVLKPMAKSLVRLEGSRGRSLEWCINTIKSHIVELPLPENQKLEAEEISLLDADPSVLRIVTVYQSILTFVKQFISEVSLRDIVPVPAGHRELLLSSLISLLGIPFCYLEFQDPKSLRRMLAEDILESVTHLTGDIFRFMRYVEDRMIQMSILGTQMPTQNSGDKVNTFSDETNSPLDLFADKDSISDLAYANFYYLILGLGLKIESVPRVYHPHYVLHSCLYLSSCLLLKPEYMLIAKGLSLAQAGLVRVEAFSVGTDVLELKGYIDFVQILSQVIIYCDVRDQRATALKIFKLYIQIFNMEAKYLVILHLYDVFNHSGLISCLTSIVKDSVLKCLESDPFDRSFAGKRMGALLTKACKMPFASSSDLVEISDEIIASLNLIRFLFIRDKTNLTGIWDCTDNLETKFLQPLRDGLDISRAHYKIKMNELRVQDKLDKDEERVKNKDEKLNDEISIMVGGTTLPTMPISEKINFCYHAINAFDVIESILVRVNECIANHPLQ